MARENILAVGRGQSLCGRAQVVAHPEASDSGCNERSEPNATGGIYALVQRFARIETPSGTDHGGSSFSVLLDDLNSFESVYGRIADYYFCTGIAAGCVYALGSTSKQCRTQDGFHISYPPRIDTKPWIAELLYGCQALEVEFRNVLRPADRRICLESLFILVRQLLRLLELQPIMSKTEIARPTRLEFDNGDIGPTPAKPGRKESPTSSPNTVSTDDPVLESFYRAQLEKIRRTYKSFAERDAQTMYFIGMLTGLAVLVLLAVLTLS
jgi:hypothetical protein